jgi:hypothetical protein
MLGKFLKKIWTHLLIAFSDNFTAEGFERTVKKFQLSENLEALSPAEKRKQTICNLFANQNLSISEIVRVLDSSLHQVIPTLIEFQLIKERRRRSGKVKSRDSLSIAPSDDTESVSGTTEDDGRAEKDRRTKNLDGDAKSQADSDNERRIA